ncbi:hypothetical protein RUM43_010221 [Polyplax serrata]|uniref:Uncharacterized protein n=1 Tax=Polyplax serrata TaxID=468196 RepID=A0AAN8P3T8_POLSC
MLIELIQDGSKEKYLQGTWMEALGRLYGGSQLVKCGEVPAKKDNGLRQSFSEQSQPNWLRKLRAFSLEELSQVKHFLVLFAHLQLLDLRCRKVKFDEIRLHEITRDYRAEGFVPKRWPW